MPKLERIHFEIAAALCGLAALIAMGTQVAGGRGLLLGNGLPMFGDFIAFWSAGRLALEGEVAAVNDADAILAMSREAVPNQAGYFPWRNPPPFLLVVTPLAALPYAAAAVAFLLASAALFAVGLRLLLPDRRALVFPLASPTFVFHLGSVQLTPLVTGLHALAFNWLDRRPIAAGAAIAALAVKPHLAVLWPLALVCQGRWRVFVSAATFAIGFAGLAALVFGPEVYTRWFAQLADAQRFLVERRLPPNTLGSLFGVLIVNGVSPQLAGMAHAASAALALVVAGAVFLRNDRRATAIALPAATLLVSHHLFFYDTLLLAISAAVLAQRRMGRLELALASSAFVVGGLTLALGFFLVLPLCWAAAWAFLIYAALRFGESAPARQR